MPILPTDNYQPNVAPSGPNGTFENVHVDPNAFTSLGRSIVGYGEVQNAIQNEADHTKALNQAMQSVNDQLYGRSSGTNGADDPGVKGYKTMIGEDAVNNRDQTLQNINDSIQNIRSTLNPAVQRMFDATAIRIQRGAEADVGNHYAQQNIVYNKTQAAAAVGLAGQQALLNSGDPSDPAAEAKWQQGLQNYHDALDKESQINGIGSSINHVDKQGNVIPATDAARERFYEGQSTLMTERIKQIATGGNGLQPDPIKAQAYFDAHRDMVTNPVQAQQLTQSLKVLTDAQYIHGDAQTAFGKMVGQQSEGEQPGQSAITLPKLDAMEGQLRPMAQQMAQARGRGNDAPYIDQQYQELHTLWAQQKQVIENTNYSNMSNVLNAVVHSGITTSSQLPSDLQQTFSDLTPQNREGVYAQMERNVRQANGEFTKSNPALVNDMRNRIYLPDGDPQKITNPGQITPYLALGVNHTDYERLRQEITQANTPEGNPFLKQVNEIKTTARKMLTTSMTGLAIQHPELAEEAAYRFGANLDDQINAARKSGKDPHSLFVPGSPDYVLSPSRVAAFMPSESAVAAQKAGSPAPAAGGFQTATNPKTGQRMMLKGGAWQPLQ